MRLLISTTTTVELIALYKNNTVLIEQAITHNRGGHGNTLLKDVEQLLDMAGISYPDIEEVIVDIGPGSFTGTRVGVATAQGLCFGLNIPLKGVSILDALRVLGEPSDKVIPVLPAARGLIYTKFPDNPQPLALNMDDLLSRLSPDQVLIGLLPDRLMDQFKDLQKNIFIYQDVTSHGFLNALESNLYVDDEVLPLNVLPPTVRRKK